MKQISKINGILNELVIETRKGQDKWCAKIADMEAVRKSFQKSYSGPDICILYKDGSDRLIHENHITLDECEHLHRDGCTFFFDEDLSKAKEDCYICGKRIEDYANEAWPVVNDGKCCNRCNYTFVVPARIAALKQIKRGGLKNVHCTGTGRTLRSCCTDNK